MLVSEGGTSTGNLNEGDRLETIRQDIKFINNMLSQQGFDCSFPMAKVIANPNDVDSLTTGDIFALEAANKILIALLNSKQKEMSFKNEQEERQKRLAEELESREITISKLINKVDLNEKEIRQLQQSLREAQDRTRQLESMAKEAVDEANRLKSAFSNKERLFQTELRKKEREFEKLKDQLQTCLREPSVVLSMVPRVENVFDMAAVRASLANSRSPSLSGMDDMSTMSDAHPPMSPPDRMELLEYENENMRQLLASTNQILSNLRVALYGDLVAEGAIQPEDVTPPTDLTPQITSLPIPWVYDQVKDEIETSLNLLSEFVNSQL